MTRLLLAGLLATAACAHRGGMSSAVCPEYRELRCATAPQCSMDRARGCQVCQCSPASTGPPPAEPLPSAVPPDLR